MTTLPNFTPVSQLTAVTEDGLPNRDAQFECVATSILMGCMQQLGITEIGGKFTPDYFKDQAVGENYMGGTSASEYVALCASLGVKLWAFNGIPGVLVSEAHKQIQAGFPVIFTEPDPYVSASLNWSHVCIFYAEEPGFLTALDPYICKAIKRTDREWTDMLLYNQIWITEKIQEEEMVTIDLNNPVVNRYFELASPDGSQWRCRFDMDGRGKQPIIQYGILEAYKAYGNSALCGLTYLGLPLSNEIPIDANGNTRQFFERGVLFYDPKNAVDNPPGAGAVYAAHLYTGAAQDPRIAPLQTQVTQLQAQLATLQAQPTSDPTIAAQVTALEAKIAAAQKALS